MKSTSFLLLVLALTCASALGARAEAIPDRALLPVAGVGVGGMGGFAGTGGMIPTGIVAILSTGPVPSNGAVLLIANQPDGVAITATPLDGASTVPINGSITQIEGAYWAWRPDSPLVPGTLYGLESRVTDGTGTMFIASAANITVTEPIDLHAPALNSEPAVSWISQLTGQVCCQLWTEFGIEIGSCAPTGQVASVQLGPGLSSPEPQALLGQYLFRIWPAGADPDDYAFNPWATPMVLELGEQADEYCYELETLSIIDGSRQVHEALDPRCAPHGTLGDVGAMQLELPSGFLDHSECHEPPSTFAADWCEVNDACGDDRGEEGCVLYGYLCEDEDLPTWPATDAGSVTAGTGGSGGTGVHVDAGMLTGGVASLAGEGGAGMGGGGDDCAVARVAHGRGAPRFVLVALLMTALGALRMRRRACR